MSSRTRSLFDMDGELTERERRLYRQLDELRRKDAARRGYITILKKQIAALKERA
jgi:hypothetical protein